MARPRSFKITIRYISKGRGANPWEVRSWGVNQDGTYRPKNSYFATRDDAEQFLADVERERMRNAVHETAITKAPGVVTFNLHANQWLRERVMDRKASTYEQYEGNLARHLRPSLGNTPMVTENFNVGQVIKLMAHLRSQGVSWNRRKAVLRTLSACLTYAMQLELIARNPCPGLIRTLKPADAVDPTPNPLTRPQVWAFLTWVKTGKLPEGYTPARTGAVDDPGVRPMRMKPLSPARQKVRAHWHPFFATLLLTGMRRGEAMGLKWTQVFLDGENPRIDITGAYNPAARRAAQQKTRDYPIDGVIAPKSGKGRTLHPLDPKLVDLLRELARTRTALALQQRRDPSPFVFLGYRGQRLLDNAMADRWFARGMAGIGATDQNHTVHDLRDTFATLQLMEDTGRLLQVSQYLGHSNPAVTLTRYARWVDQGDAAASAAFLRALADPGDTQDADLPLVATSASPRTPRTPRAGVLQVVHARSRK